MKEKKRTLIRDADLPLAHNDETEIEDRKNHHIPLFLQERLMKTKLVSLSMRAKNWNCTDIALGLYRTLCIAKVMREVITFLFSSRDRHPSLQ